MKPKKTGGGWAAIRYTLRMANRVGWRRLWQAMRAKNACKTCALGMGGQAGGMRNETGPLAGGLQEVVAGDGRRHAGGPHARVLRNVTRSPSCRRCRRASWNGAAGSRTPLYAGPGDTHYRAIAWDDALDRIVRPAADDAAGRELLLRQRPIVQRSGLPAAALRPALRHQLRQQLLVLLPPGQRRRPRPVRSAPAPPRSRSKTSRTPTCSSSSAATRRRTIRG